MKRKNESAATEILQQDSPQAAQVLSALYAQGAREGDLLLFGREAYSDRRGFLRGAGLGLMTALVGAAIPYHRFMPAGLIPVALAAEGTIAGKDGLRVLNDRPLNAETPAHLLDDEVTPTARHFIRNNGIPPVDADAQGWSLALDGEVDRPATYSISDLRSRFQVYTYQLQLECGGNGRSAFRPPASGNQWSTGAVACANWSGVRLMDVLEAAGVKKSAVYTAHYGADAHLSGAPGKLPISRGVPIQKALSPYNLIAFAQNGAPIHPMNGAPLRLVIPGWPGSVSQKWLRRIQIRDQVHDGPKMTGTSYRVPEYKVAPGSKVPKKDFAIIHSMPVKSLITAPVNMASVQANQSFEVRGHAWAGDRSVKSLHVTTNFGKTWRQATLDQPVNPYAWQNWRISLRLPQAGYYEVWVLAIDDRGVQQPFGLDWNPKGYLNNTLHRVAVMVG